MAESKTVKFSVRYGFNNEFAGQFPGSLVDVDIIPIVYMLGKYKIIYHCDYKNMYDKPYGLFTDHTLDIYFRKGLLDVRKIDIEIISADDPDDYEQLLELTFSSTKSIVCIANRRDLLPAFYKLLNRLAKAYYSAYNEQLNNSILVERRHKQLDTAENDILYHLRTMRWHEK
jgi:hypothetical protein